MTLAEAIRTVDEERPNDYPERYKRERIDRLEAEIDEMYGRYVMPADLPSYSGITPESPDGTELLAPRQYSDVYKWWVLLAVDLAVGDTSRAANDRAMFNAEWSALAAWCAREHAGKGDHYLIV